ncbi:MAG: hypothetical protein JKY34_00340 [Kordiimonadaceae bacterium]|nr:hypothetical protein [Kordiimonadaceae bacterium]
MIAAFGKHAAIRLRYLGLLTSLVLLLCFSLPATAQSEDNTQEITDLSDAYTEIEEALAAQTAELDRVLEVGYGGPALGKDITDIAENVATLESRLQDLSAQLINLIKKLNFNPISPFQLIVHKGGKDTPPLMSSARPGDRVYLTADIQHAVLAENTETRLSWVLMMPDGTPSNKLHKSEDSVRMGERATYSFGISTKGMALGTYQMELTHSVVGEPKQHYKTIAEFTLAEVSELKITKMVIDDERSGDMHQSIIPDGAFPYMFAYFEAPGFINRLTADFRVRDLTIRKTIYAKKGIKTIKPDVDQQRFGVVLDPAKVSIISGHEYRFNISLKDDLRGDAVKDTLKTVKEEITFFYGEEPKRITIDKLVISNDAEAAKTLRNIPVSPTVFLTSWYKATKPVGAIDVSFRLTSAKGDETIVEKTIAHANQKDTVLDKVTLPIDAALLTPGAEYRVETSFLIEGMKAVKSTRKFIYAKLAPVDMQQLVKVSGSINTPGQGRSLVNPKKTNPLKLSSKVSFKVPAVHREGMEGTLYWNLDGVRQSVFVLDGSSTNWNYSFDAKSMGSSGSYRAELIHRRSPRSRPQTLYSSDFSVSLPFSAYAFGGDKPLYEPEDVGKKGAKPKRLPEWKGYAWVRDKVGVRVKARDFPVKINVTIKATLKETGQTLISETKSVILAAKEETELEWKLDQAALQFDLGSIFPNFDTKRDLNKTIETKFTVEDDKGYKVDQETTTTHWLYILNGDDDFIKAADTAGNKVGKISPPSLMKGPYTTTLQGLSFYDIKGLNVTMRSKELENWVKAVGARKIREDDEREYFAKTVPLLITLKDSAGKQAVLYWENYTFTAGLPKPQIDNGN